MSESPPRTSTSGTGGDEQDRLLLIVIASNPATLDDLVTALLDIGITGGTVVESKGLGTILREEMPIFAGLASMLPQNTASRVLISVTTRNLADAFFSYLEQELKQSQRPIVATVPVDRSMGLTR